MSGQTNKASSQKSKPQLPPESEWRFDKLHEGEYERCFQYEITRYAAPRLRTRLQQELADLPADDPNGADSSHVKVLGDQLESLRQFDKPWRTLTDDEKNSVLPPLSRKQEPVKLTPQGYSGRIFRMLPESDVVQTLEVTVDWSQADTRLADSFLKLVRRLRHERGKRNLVKERRGPPSDTVQNRLFALAVWRLRGNGLTHKRAWEELLPVRKKLGIAGSNERYMGQFSRRIARLIG